MPKKNDIKILKATKRGKWAKFSWKEKKNATHLMGENKTGTAFTRKTNSTNVTFIITTTTTIIIIIKKKNLPVTTVQCIFGGCVIFRVVLRSDRVYY